MKLIEVKCPHCNATAKAGSNNDTVSCEYCGTTSLVQRRAGILGRPVAPPTPSAPELRELPLATQKHGKGCLIVLLFPLFLIMLPVVIFIVVFTTVSWQGTERPIAVDVNGDGVADAVGRVWYTQRDLVRIAAYDGKTGDELWESETLGEYSDTLPGTLAVSGDAVLYIWADGKVQAFDLPSGEHRWGPRALGEKVRQVCGGPSGTVVIKTSDKVMHHVKLADGARSKSAGELCRPAWSDRRPADGSLEPKERLHVSTAQMNIDWAIKRGDGPWIALGAKKKGTSVPMIAAFTKDADLEGHDTVPPLWTATLPATDPLKASSSSTKHAALSEKAAFALYKWSDSDRLPRLTALSLKDGKRLWDVEVESDRPLEGLAYGTGRLFVSVWGTLRVFDAATGELLWEVGN